MNSTTLAKIEAAAPFLLQFRNEVPPHLQNLITPYLDQPYQLALKILDCCLDGTPVSLDEISTSTGISKVTVRQVLSAFQQSSIQLQSQPKRWQLQAKSQRQLISTR